MTRACPSNSEAFSAAAKALDVGIVVLEAFVEAVPGEVDPSSTQQWQAFGVDDDFHAVAFVHRVTEVDAIRQLDDIGKPGAAGGLLRAHEGPRRRIGARETSLPARLPLRSGLWPCGPPKLSSDFLCSATSRWYQRDRATPGRVSA